MSLYAFWRPPCRCDQIIDDKSLSVTMGCITMENPLAPDNGQTALPVVHFDLEPQNSECPLVQSVNR